jgi:hypothetical protein
MELVGDLRIPVELEAQVDTLLEYVGDLKHGVVMGNSVEAMPVVL